jgi:hypothetical protein
MQRTWPDLRWPPAAADRFFSRLVHRTPWFQRLWIAFLLFPVVVPRPQHGIVKPQLPGKTELSTVPVNNSLQYKRSWMQASS